MLWDEHECRCHASADQQNLSHRVGVCASTVKARDQVRHRHIEKTGGGKRQAIWQQDWYDLQCEERHYRAASACKARCHVEQQGAPARIAGVEQDSEVADFLRDLMRGEELITHLGREYYD